MATRDELAVLRAQMAELQRQNAMLVQAVTASQDSGDRRLPTSAPQQSLSSPLLSSSRASKPQTPERSSSEQWRASSAGVGAQPSVILDPTFVPPEPKKAYGEVRIWTGTWNMGAVDPFLDRNIDRDYDFVSRMLGPFVPHGYDLYVLGVQEGISDKVFDAVAAYTGTFRLPLHCKLYPAREGHSISSSVRSRRLGRAIPVQSFIDEASAGALPEPVVSTADMLDRVWGRGDGALLTPKFTGLAVFVSPALAPFTRLLGVYKHSFGAAEGSKVRRQ
jgi:hypothetical protein